MDVNQSSSPGDMATLTEFFADHERLDFVKPRAETTFSDILCQGLYTVDLLLYIDII